MVGTFWRGAMLSLGLLALGGLPAAAQATSKPMPNCRAAVDNGTTRIVCTEDTDGPLRPAAPSREDIAYTRQPGPAPVRQTGNFCGDGFRPAGDGTCRLAP